MTNQSILVMNKDGKIMDRAMRADWIGTRLGNPTKDGEPTVELGLDCSGFPNLPTFIAPLTKEGWIEIFQDIMDIFNEMEEDQ